MNALSSAHLAWLTLLAVAVQLSFSAQKKKKQNNVFFSGTGMSGEIIHPGRTDTEGGSLLIRRMVQRAQEITSDDRTNGDLTIETNACLDPATCHGPLWGTFILENSGGKWLAAWIGQKTTRGATIYAMGYGVGEYNGLMANWTYTRYREDQHAPFDIHGFIVRKN